MTQKKPVSKAFSKQHELRWLRTLPPAIDAAIGACKEGRSIDATDILEKAMREQGEILSKIFKREQELEIKNIALRKVKRAAQAFIAELDACETERVSTHGLRVALKEEA